MKPIEVLTHLIASELEELGFISRSHSSWAKLWPVSEWSLKPGRRHKAVGLYEHIERGFACCVLREENWADGTYYSLLLCWEVPLEGVQSSFAVRPTMWTEFKIWWKNASVWTRVIVPMFTIPFVFLPYFILLLVIWPFQALGIFPQKRWHTPKERSVRYKYKLRGAEPNPHFWSWILKNEPNYKIIVTKEKIFFLERFYHGKNQEKIMQVVETVRIIPTLVASIQKTSPE